MTKQIFYQVIAVGLLGIGGIMLYIGLVINDQVRLANPRPNTDLVYQPQIMLLTGEEQIVLDQINQYRLSQKLPAVAAEASVCRLAQQRATEIISNWSHTGFLTRILPHAGLWSENLARYVPVRDLVRAWIASPAHQANLLKNTPFICVAHQGQFWAMIGWKP